MAKSKKNIGAFQEAMLSNTKMIASEKEQEDAIPQKATRQTSGNPTTNSSGIPNASLQKIEAFSKKYKIPVESVLTTSIDLFLSLEDYWFDTAE